eukprot:238019-Pleurochrysis_carterae.AAC.2
MTRPPMCSNQNTQLALARSQAADSSDPLLKATQADVSSRSAAREKLEPRYPILRRGSVEARGVSWCAMGLSRM